MAKLIRLFYGNRKAFQSCFVYITIIMWIYNLFSLLGTMAFGMEMIPMQMWEIFDTWLIEIIWFLKSPWQVSTDVISVVEFKKIWFLKKKIFGHKINIFCLALHSNDSIGALHFWLETMIHNHISWVPPVLPHNLCLILMEMKKKLKNVIFWNPPIFMLTARLLGRWASKNQEYWLIFFLVI